MKTTMFKHKGNGKTYEIERHCKIKLPATLTRKSEWVEGIVYVDACGMSYVRTKENFDERFELTEESKNAAELERLAYKYIEKHKGVADDLAYKLEDAVEDFYSHGGKGNPFKDVKFTDEERRLLAEAGCV